MGPQVIASPMKPATNGNLLSAVKHSHQLMLCSDILLTKPVATEENGAEVVSCSGSCKAATGRSIARLCFGIQLRGKSVPTSSLTPSTNTQRSRRFTTSFLTGGLTLFNGRLRLAPNLGHRYTTTAAAQLMEHTRCCDIALSSLGQLSFLTSA